MKRQIPAENKYFLAAVVQPVNYFSSLHLKEEDINIDLMLLLVQGKTTWKVELSVEHVDLSTHKVIKPGVYFDLSQNPFTSYETFYALLLQYFCRITLLVDTSLPQPLPAKAIIQNSKHLETCLWNRMSGYNDTVHSRC